MSDLEMEFSDKQSLALSLLSNSKDIKVLGYGGSKGGGKSHLARAWLYLRAKKYPGSVGLLVRKTYQELYRNHTKRFIKDFPDLRYVERKNHLELPNGSLIELAYCESDSDLERFQGVEFDSLVIDQAEQHAKTVFHYLWSCKRTTNPDIKTKSLLTFNPGGIGHAWIKRMFIDSDFEESDPEPNEIGFVKASVYDNRWVTEEYRSNLEHLPVQMREAYLNGSFDTFQGQFFSLKPDSVEEPFEIDEGHCFNGQLYGSLDHGISHPTVYNQFYVDNQNNIHLLFTYLANGDTANGHAREIKDRIEAFRWTKGHMPCKIFADPSMWTKSRLNPQYVSSPIDEYKAVFNGKSTFIEANNNKVHGCGLMRQVLVGTHGYPSFFYWPHYNASFVEGIKSVITDENNREVYLKMDGDDIADCCRYGVVGAYSDTKNKSNMMRNRAYINKRQSEFRQKSFMEI